MRLLKSEFELRFRNGVGGGRDESPLHPETLCEHDILVWRAGHSGSSDKDGDPRYLDPQRINDCDSPTRDNNNRERDFKKICNQIHRTFL